MVVWLRVTDSHGNDLGKIEIRTNRTSTNRGAGELLVWEWHSESSKLGGRAAWKHNGQYFRLELQDSAGHVLITVADGASWRGPVSGPLEPSRPWFGPGRATGGLLSRQTPTAGPSSLFRGGNWTYTSGH
jgi:hypothetical protein